MPQTVNTSISGKGSSQWIRWDNQFDLGNVLV